VEIRQPPGAGGWSQQAVQMIAANDAALMFLRRSTSGGDIEANDANALRATRLNRISGTFQIHQVSLEPLPAAIAR
jgi:hypothetical protein